METITANCPKCKTQYQLTEEQLAVAGGQVRCGSCMTVFQARDEQTAAPEPQTEVSSSFVNSDDEEVLYGDDASESSEPAIDDNFSDSFENIVEDTDSFGSLIDASDEVEKMESGDAKMDESWAEELLDDEDEELIEDFTDNQSVSHTQALGADSSDFDDLGLDESLKLSSVEDDDEEEELAFNDVSNPFAADEKEGILKRIIPEPLEFHLGVHNKRVAKVLYSIVAVIALLGLFVQYSYFQFDNLARQATWRPLYSVACTVIACQLPSLYKVDEISAKHLTVKSHPYYERVLVVDTIITNHANIKQPFPQLELYFTDNNQKIVAARRFKPEEYLRGELAAKTMMPSRQPVHLAIEIDDPGKTASGYWVKLSYLNNDI